ncbi:MAG: bifunctional oligoribonuclease/PAP phosphatase NrnA [Ruminococcus sp.]|jgi:phosphoesterase RecJ-like protein|nr:bifunctional oligoribonuclease/PAP phosphatase NrnA [Ruminococcus sp.]
MAISYEEAARLIMGRDNFCIITHKSPDGDTVGSGFGLYYALTEIGKNACVLCSDDFPKKFKTLYNGYENKRFTPKFFIAVDIADTQLIGNDLKKYADYIDLCIDHHASNTNYAKNVLLEADAAAAAEVVYKLLRAGDMPVTQKTAECLYTGIVTDTGCFKYPSVTVQTHRIAAELMEIGISYADINRMMFDTKSKGRIAAENYVQNKTEYYLDERCAFCALSKETIDNISSDSEDFDELAALTIQLESVEVGILVKEKEKGKFRISIRSSKNVNVSEICSEYGGGGHFNAAGCTIDGRIEDVRMMLIKSVGQTLGIDLWMV